MNDRPSRSTSKVQHESRDHLCATDPAFNIVLESLIELKGQDRVRVTLHQAETLRNIASNDDDEDRNFMFGGEEKAVANSVFGRTASAVARMIMLEAAGVPRDCRRWIATLVVPCEQRPFDLPKSKGLCSQGNWGEDGEFNRQLKELMVLVEIEEQYFEEMTKVKEKKDIDLAFAKLNVKDKNE